MMYWDKAAAGCDFTTLFVCFRVRVGRRVASPPRTFSKRTKCVVCLRPKLVTASCALYLIHNVIIIIPRTCLTKYIKIGGDAQKKIKIKIKILEANSHFQIITNTHTNK